METDLPPPYEGLPRFAPQQSNQTIRRKPINRKPVPGPSFAANSTVYRDTSALSSRQKVDIDPLAAKLAASNLDGCNTTSQPGSWKPVVPPGAGAPIAVNTQTVDTVTPLELVQSPAETLSPISSSTPTSATSNSTSTSPWKARFEDVRYFAGGLMSRPVETTKHFTVMRHSHGIVYYQGAATSVAVTIFSDQPLPVDRSLWLQCRGWSGNTGLRIGTLVKGAGNWIDVTPSHLVTADQLKPSDERAWQRDIMKFSKKVKKGAMAKHVVRETAIVRIPAETQNGYFRVVLCSGPKKKVLCPSPVFRVSSMSSNPGTLRGASLGTLPLELGGKIITSIASSGLRSAVTPLQNAISANTPGKVTTFATEEVVTGLYDVSGAKSKLESANKAYYLDKEADLEHIRDETTVISDKIEKPFPITWTSRVLPHEMDQQDLEAFIINIDQVPDTIVYLLLGHYFGWVKINSSKQVVVGDAYSLWIPAVISNLPCSSSDSKASVKSGVKRKMTVYMIHNFEEEVTFAGASVHVKIMGFLRPPNEHFIMTSPSPAQTEGSMTSEETAALAMIDDIATTLAALGRPGWEAEDLTTTVNSNQKKGLKDQYTAARQATQDRIDSLKLHQYGFRTEKDVLMDKVVGNGGYYVLR